jgi:hypothetical protein
MIAFSMESWWKEKPSASIGSRSVALLATRGPAQAATTDGNRECLKMTSQPTVNIVSQKTAVEATEAATEAAEVELPGEGAEAISAATPTCAVGTIAAADPTPRIFGAKHS